MPRVVISPTANSDLTNVWLYVAAHSPANADSLVDRFDRIFRVLAEHPYMGRGRDELAANLHSFPVGNYIVFYRPLGDGIEIARILHGARDIGALF